jgi:hypothetical protein
MTVAVTDEGDLWKGGPHDGGLLIHGNYALTCVEKALLELAPQGQRRAAEEQQTGDVTTVTER